MKKDRSTNWLLYVAGSMLFIALIGMGMIVNWWSIDLRIQSERQEVEQLLKNRMKSEHTDPTIWAAINDMNLIAAFPVISYTPSTPLRCIDHPVAAVEHVYKCCVCNKVLLKNIEHKR